MSRLILPDNDIVIPRRWRCGIVGHAVVSGGSSAVPDLLANTLNPSDKSATITLSGSNLIATSTNGSRKGVRAVTPIKATDGKVVFGCYLNPMTGSWGYPWIGLSPSGGSLISDLGSYANSFGFNILNTRVDYRFNVGAVTNITPSTPGYSGVFCAIYVDRDANTIGWEQDGVLFGPYSASMSGDLYPHFAPYSLNDAHTVVFARASFPYVVRAGYKTFG